MRVLVLGASGYVGNQVARSLSSAGFEVLRGSRQQSDDPDAIKYPGNPADLAFVRQMTLTLRESEVSWIVHAANEARKGVEIDSSAAMLLGNLFFPSAVLQAAINANVTGFINIGSGWQISDSMKPIAPNYITTKEGFRHFLGSNSHRLITKTIFVNEIFGPGDRRDKLINLAIQAIENGEQLKLKTPESLVSLVFASRLGDEVAGLIKNPLSRPAEYVFDNYSLLTVQELVKLLGDIVKGDYPEGEPKWRIRMSDRADYPVFGEVTHEEIIADLRMTAKREP